MVDKFKGLNIEKAKEARKRIHRIKLLLTLAFVLAYIAWGMSLGMGFASLPDMIVRLNTTVEGISLAFAFGSIGTIVSAPFGIASDSLKMVDKFKGLNIEKAKEARKRIHRIKLLLTLAFVLAYIAWGMSLGMGFASLPDMIVRLNTTVEGISLAFAFGSIGTIVSAPFGIASDRIGNYSGLIVGVCLVVSSVMAVLKPYSPVLWFYGICSFLETLAWSLLQIVTNSCLMLMWREAANSPLHVMNLGYPIGAFIGGQIARAFVSNNITDNSTDSSQFNTPECFETYDDKEFLDESRIELGFIIIGCCNLSVGLLCVILQFTAKGEGNQEANKRPYSWNEIFHPSQWGHGDSRFALVLVCLFVSLQVGLVGCENGISQYLATYAVDSDLGFSNQEAATLTSVYYLFESIGIFACIFIGNCVSLRFMVFAEVHGIAFVALLLLIFGTQSKMALYVLAPAISIFKGPAWASIFTWPDFYITLLSLILVVATVIVGILNVFMVVFQGYLYTNTVIESIFYTTLGYGLFMCILTYLVYYVTWNKPGRHQDKIELNVLPQDISKDALKEHGTKNVDENRITHL